MDGNGQTKGIAKRSAEVGLLASRLTKVVIGEVIEYATLANIVGESVTGGGRGTAWLYSARRIVQSEQGIVFDTVRCVGLQRADAAGKVEKSKLSRKRIHREAHRGLKILETVVPEELTPEGRLDFNTTASHLGILKHVTKATSVKRLESVIQAEQQRLPLAKTLEAFKGS